MCGVRSGSGLKMCGLLLSTHHADFLTTQAKKPRLEWPEKWMGWGWEWLCSVPIQWKYLILTIFFFFLQLLKLLYSDPHLLYYVCTVWYKYESNLLLMKCVCAVTYADDILMFLDSSFFFFFFLSFFLSPCVCSGTGETGLLLFFFFFFLFWQFMKKTSQEVSSWTRCW